MGNNTNVVRVVGLFDANVLSDVTGLRCDDESLTHQEFAEESDINTIIDRFGIGENPIEPMQWKTNVDITNAPDTYMGVMNELIEALFPRCNNPVPVTGRHGVTLVGCHSCI